MFLYFFLTFITLMMLIYIIYFAKTYQRNHKHTVIETPIVYSSWYPDWWNSYWNVGTRGYYYPSYGGNYNHPHHDRRPPHRR